MSDMKCPFCQQELRKIHPTYVICDSCRITGEDKLWQELIRTRKALDVALCSLQDIAESDGDFITGASTPLDEHEYAEMMLNKIKTIIKGGKDGI